jgi:hypothetical protein
MIENLLDYTGASGAIPRKDRDRMDEHAELYYEEIRKRNSDIKKIAENTGYSEKEIETIKNHLFLNKYDLGQDTPTFFDADYDIAVSWQRLIEGKNIQEMDLVLLAHELLEYQIMSERKISYKEAHKITEKTFSYAKFVKQLDSKEGIK